MRVCGGLGRVLCVMREYRARLAAPQLVIHALFSPLQLPAAGRPHLAPAFRRRVSRADRLQGAGAGLREPQPTTIGPPIPSSILNGRPKAAETRFLSHISIRDLFAQDLNGRVVQTNMWDGLHYYSIWIVGSGWIAVF